MAYANGSQLLARLRAIRESLELTPYALPDVAAEVIRDVQDSADANLSGQEYQVGFDLGQFKANIAQPGSLVIRGPGVGHIGILDTDRMGNADDFEKIAGEPGLFHQGTGDRHLVWRNVVYPNRGLRDEVAAGRQKVWGSKTPQWLLLNDGFSGNGSFPPTPATDFIGQGTREATVIGKLFRRFHQMFRGL